MTDCDDKLLVKYETIISQYWEEPILNEARLNPKFDDTDKEFGIPAIEDGMRQVISSGKMNAGTLLVMLDYAPKNSISLPLMIAYLNADAQAARTEETMREANAQAKILRALERGIEAIKNLE